MVLRLLCALALFVAFLFCLAVYGFYTSVRPLRRLSGKTPVDLGLEYENVIFTTEDGLKLEGWLIPRRKSKKAVVCLHGYPFDKGSILDVSSFLRNKFSLLYFDFRYLGKSQGKYTSIGYHEVKDVRAAVEFLLGRGYKRIGLIGFSMGAATAIMEASQNASINAVVSDSSYSTLDRLVYDKYRCLGPLRYPLGMVTKLISMIFMKVDPASVSPEKAIRSLDIPVLIIHGDSDREISIDNARYLYNASSSASLWVVRGVDHCGAHAGKTGEYEKKVLSFFEKSL